MDAPPDEAVQYLKANPDTWSQFKSTFGTLPENFTPPAAPQEAVDYLNKNPNSSAQFQDTFGYLPPSVKGGQSFVDRGAPAKSPSGGDITAQNPTGWNGNTPNTSLPPSEVSQTRAGAVDAWHKGGIAGVRDYFLSTKPGKLISAFTDFSQGGQKSQGPLDDAALSLTKNLAAMGSGLMRLPELTWNYLGQNEPDDIKAENQDNRTPQQRREGVPAPTDVVGQTLKNTTSALADKFKQGETYFTDAMSPAARAGIEKHMIDTSKNGSWKLGEGTKDPYWWMDSVTSMAPMIATDGASMVASKAAYASKFTQVLAKAAAEQAPLSVARTAAQTAALRAAHQAAVVTNIGANGLVFGGEAADQTHDAINGLTEETLMNYAPYRELREHGLSHEAAREQVATSGGLLAGITTAVTAGLGGEPLNRFMAKWASKIPATASRVGSAATAGVAGAAQGAAIGAGSQLGQNMALSPITGQSVWEGVLDSTVRNALTGGVLGASIGAVSGKAAARGPQDVKDDVVSQKLKDFVTARENFQAAQRAAADPAVPIKHQDILDAKDQYQQASISLNQELLAQGKLQPAQQKTVAAALSEAQARGIELPETTYDHNQSGTLPGASAESRQVGEAPTGPNATGEAGGGAKEPPSAGAGATAPLSGAESSRLEALNKIANAEPIEGQVMHDLVANGLAKVTPSGLPVLLPEGRRLRTSLVEKGAPAPVAVEAPETKSAATAETKSDQGALPTLGEGPLSAEEDPTLRLTGTEYGNLERLGAGKKVDPSDMVPLHQAGLIKPSDSEGGFSLLPAGRRELSEFQATRQTALERAVQPHLELDHGETLTTVGKAEQARKLADIETAYRTRSEQSQAVRQAAFDKAELVRQAAKQADFSKARGQQADQTALQAAHEPAGGFNQLGQALGGALKKIHLDSSLKGEDANIQGRFAKQIERNPEKAITDYGKLPETMGGKFVSADIARELSPDYLKDRTRSSAVQEPASELAKEMFSRQLTRPLKKSEVPGVIFTSGGTGAGKTSGLEAAMKMDPKITRARAFYDSNLASLDSAVRRIEAVKKSGNQAHVLHTYREPVQAWTDGVLKRATKQENKFGTGRTVPMDVHAATHANSNRVIHALASRYAGDDQVKITVVDNSHGKGGARVIPVEQLPVLDYNTIRSKLNDATESEHVAGRISDATYRGVRGEPVPESRTNGGPGPEYDQLGTGPLDESPAFGSAVGFRGEPRKEPNGSGKTLRKGSAASRGGGKRKAAISNGQAETDGPQGSVAFKLATRKPLLNVVLDVNGGGKVDPDKVVAALKKMGVEVTKQNIHQSGTEPTLVASLSRKLTDAEAMKLSKQFKQDAVAQYANGAGKLHGPAAEKWGPFNPDYFLNHEGKSLASEDDVLKLKHFSDATDQQMTLDPERYGTGLKGAEARRMANNKGLKTISAYAMGGEVEPELRGKTQYHIQVPRSEMYDLSTDPEDFIGKNTDEYGNYDHSQAEKDIAGAGYRGYHLPGAEGNLRGQARFFKPTDAFRADVAARMPDKWTADQVAQVKEHLSAEEQNQLRRDSAQRMTDVFHALPDAKELAAAALAGKAKKGWYQKAGEAIHSVFGGDAPRFSAVLAAMSPQTSVEMNFHNALRTFVNWDKAGRPTDRSAIVKIMGDSVLGNKKTDSVLGAWINNTVRALTTEDPESLTLSGPKVSSFMKNLQGKTNEVTLDSWMAAFAKVNQQMFGGKLTQTGPGKSAGYLGFSAKVREAGKILEQMTGDKWSPAEVQETVWSWAKAAYEHADEFGSMGSIPEMVKNGEITDELVKGTADFHSLFGRPEHSAVLGDSNFRTGLEQLRGTEGFGAERGASSQAEEAARSALSPHLHSAAERLETLRQERAAGAKGAGTTDDVPFRQGGSGTGMSREDIRGALQEIQAHLGVPIEVHDSHTELPDYIQSDFPGVERAMGMYISDPNGGSIHLMGRNIPNAEEARATAIHEAVGHQGLRSMLGSQYGEVMDQLVSSFPDQVDQAAKHNGIRVLNADERAFHEQQAASEAQQLGGGTGKSQKLLDTMASNRRYAAEEMVAYASEQVLGKDIEAKPGVFQSIVNFVREKLRAIGILKGWNDTDLNNLIYASRDYVRSQWIGKMYARDQLAERAGQQGFNPSGDNVPMAKLKGVPTSGNKDLESFVNKIGMTDKPLKQRWEDATRDIIARTETAIFDHFHGIDRAENIAGISASDRGYKSASLSTNAGGLMRAILEDGHPIWKDRSGNEVTGRQSAPGDVHDVNTDPTEGGGHGLLDIFKPLGKDLNKWSAWMVARRAERLLGEGRENLFSPAEIAAAKAMGSPQFEAVAKEYAAFKGKILDWAQQAGIINPESRAMWDHGDYIPFYRVMENGNMNASAGNRGLGYVKNQIARLRGGENNIGDPIQNIMTNFSNLIESGLRAHAARATVDNLAGSGFVTEIKGMRDAVTTLDRAGFKAAHPQVAKDLQAIGVDIDHMPDDAFRGMQKLLLSKAPPDEGAVSVWRGGSKEYWHVHDPVLFRSLQAISPTTWGPWMKLFSLPKRALTLTSTMTPEFAASVGWKHMWQAFVQGRTADAATPFTLGVDNVKGAIKFLTHDPSVIHARAQGGLFEGLGYDPVGAAKETRMTLQRAAGANVINTPRKAWLAYRSVIGVSENMNRLAIYDNALSSGMSPLEAAYEAKSTMDYHKRGNAQLARFIFDTVPFMGAHVSALHTLFKNATSSPQAAMRVAMRGALLSMASIAYVAMNHNDPNYQALTDKDKASYWHFWLPSMGHFKVPKPFETGTIFATIPEAMMDAAVTNSDEPDKNWAALNLVAHSFLEEDSLSPRVAAVWPELELAMNKNTFNGSPILTQSDQKVLPEEQDSPYVHSTYRWLANEMPDIAPNALRSPKQLQHLGQGYFGGVQDYVLAVTDAMARKANGESAPATAHGSLPLFSRFYQEGPMSQTKYSNTMYDVADQAANVMGSIKKLSGTNTPKAAGRIDSLLKSNPDLVAADQPFNSAVKQVDDLRRQMREVQSSDLSPNEKRAALDEMQTAINETAKSVWDIRPGGKFSPSVAVKLQGQTKDQQVDTLAGAGLPHTAQLLKSLPASPPKVIMNGN